MSTQSIHAESIANSILTELDQRIEELFPLHPFEWGIDSRNFEYVIAEHLAISIAFPYIQAGAIYENYNRNIRPNGETDSNIEITSAIASFLVWDEFGGHSLVQEHGEEGLRYLTRVDRNFHSNLLRRDIEMLLGKAIDPIWTDLTKEYTSALLDGLSDGKNNRNVAYMIAFEKHARALIESMWSSIHRIFRVPKDPRLKYFYGHVGGDSPAEAFHIEMTQKMIDHLVPDHEREKFLATCIAAYAANIQWCEAIVLSDPNRK